jgi:hypothetical protein
LIISKAYTQTLKCHFCKISVFPVNNSHLNLTHVFRFRPLNYIVKPIILIKGIFILHFEKQTRLEASRGKKGVRPVTFTLGPWSSVLGRIHDKNDRCAFTRGFVSFLFRFLFYNHPQCSVYMHKC